MACPIQVSRGSLPWFNTSEDSRGRSNVPLSTSEVKDAQGQLCHSNIRSKGQDKVIMIVSEGQIMAV